MTSSLQKAQIYLSKGILLFILLLLPKDIYSQHISDDVIIAAYETLTIQQGERGAYPVFTVKNRGTKEYRKIQIRLSNIYGRHEGKKVHLDRESRRIERIDYLQPGQEVIVATQGDFGANVDQPLTTYSCNYTFSFSDAEEHSFTTPQKTISKFVQVIPFNEVTNIHSDFSNKFGSLIHEGPHALVFSLPNKGTSSEECEKAAIFISSQILEKGLAETIGGLTTTAIGSLSSLALTFLTAMPTVGIPTDVTNGIITKSDATNRNTTIGLNQPFLPFAVISGGDCFNFSTLLNIKRRTFLFCWKLVNTIELLSYDEENRMLSEKRTIELGQPFLVIGKTPIYFEQSGVYQLAVQAWCDSEGQSSMNITVK